MRRVLVCHLGFLFGFKSGCGGRTASAFVEEIAFIKAGEDAIAPDDSAVDHGQVDRACRRPPWRSGWPDHAGCRHNRAGGCRWRTDPPPLPGASVPRSAARQQVRAALGGIAQESRWARAPDVCVLTRPGIAAYRRNECSASGWNCRSRPRHRTPRPTRRPIACIAGISVTSAPTR